MPIEPANCAKQLASFVGAIQRFYDSRERNPLFAAAVFVAALASMIPKVGFLIPLEAPADNKARVGSGRIYGQDVCCRVFNVPTAAMIEQERRNAPASQIDQLLDPKVADVSRSDDKRRLRVLESMNYRAQNVVQNVGRGL